MLVSDNLQPAQAEPRSPEWLGRTLRVVASTEPWRAAAFLLSSFVLGVFWFVVITALVSTGASLVITFVGIPLLILSLLVWQQAARLERWRVRVLLGVEIRDPYRPVPDGPLLTRLKLLVTDWAIWRDLLYLGLLFPLAVIEFVILTVALSIPLTLLSLPMWY
jgi:hypothetical protein